MATVRCFNIDCKYHKDGECAKDEIEMSTRYIEDSEGKSSYVQYCTDEEEISKK